MSNIHEKALRKHETLVDLCKSLLITQGHTVETHVEYDRGEIDLLCRGIYYEIKCNRTQKSVKKSIDQIKRAMQCNQASYGYLVTYDGLYDVVQ